MTKSKDRLVIEALEKIFGKTVRVIVTDGKITTWAEPSEVQPTNEQIEQQIELIKLEEPMNLLRRERDVRLSECDWRLAPDYPKADQQAWILYRQNLRDLPSRIIAGELERPEIEEDGSLLFSQWPQKPNS